MKRLILLRHAKSSWDHPGLDDAERPLAPRGRRAAPVVARYLEDQIGLPDQVLCSPAVRARQTWELVAAEWKQDVPTETERAIYMAAPSSLLRLAQQRFDSEASIMLVGHNPGMEELAGRLTQPGDSDAHRRLREKYPTAGLAVIEFDVAQWSDLEWGTGRLVDFVRPKDLM